MVELEQGNQDLNNIVFIYIKGYLIYLTLAKITKKSAKNHFARSKIQNELIKYKLI